MAVAVLVSLGPMAPIVEPWIYRALVNDLAGVLAAPALLRAAERTFDDWVQHGPPDILLREAGYFQEMMAAEGKARG